jgi:porphyrinogen peroxidase
MKTPQAGILALGTASHAYLEFDVSPGRQGRDLVAVISSMREPRTTMGGVNLVAGFRPELWKKVLPDQAPADIEGSNHDIVGPDRFVIRL